MVEVEHDADGPTSRVAKPRPLAQAQELLPVTLSLAVARTGEARIIEDARSDPQLAHDPFVCDNPDVQSICCVPITARSQVVGVLYLENRLATAVFTTDRLQVLEHLAAQAAISLGSAALFDALRAREAQWRSLVDAVPDTITLIDAHGRVEFINRLDHFARTRARVVGHPAEDLFEAGSLPAWREAWADILGDSELRELELCVSIDQGGRRWFMTRLVRIGAEDQPCRVLAISTNITERKTLEARLHQQQRLEAIGTLAAGVAHEINNPIHGIMSYAEMIEDPSTDREATIELAHEIGQEGGRVTAIVRNLLTFSRQEEQQSLEDIDVRELLEASLTLARAVLRQDSIRLELSVAEEMPTLRCRPQQIRQIILNLITNARDALRERFPGFDARKRITISAEPFVRDQAPWVRIMVEDTGGGIPVHIQARIFDPFFTTKSRDEGTGLGLSVSHGIAAEHGGELGLESELGVGTRFYLDLPVRELEA